MAYRGFGQSILPSPVMLDGVRIKLAEDRLLCRKQIREHCVDTPPESVGVAPRLAAADPA